MGCYMRSGVHRCWAVAIAWAVALVLMVIHVQAVNITVTDFTGPGVNQPVSGPLWVWNGGPGGAANEDNETEATVGVRTPQGQKWDLEMFAIESGSLKIVGGYDFIKGVTGATPGDLFIKVGGAPPSHEPLNYSSRIINGPYYGYDYAVDLSHGFSTGKVNVYDLGPSSVLQTAENDFFGSNPWKFYSTPEAILSTAVAYATYGAGYRGLLGDGNSSPQFLAAWEKTDRHNELSIDLDFLAIEPGTPIYFSYTMGCGNDMLKGILTVPDGGATFALLGIALGGLLLIRQHP